jgi:hypothetical protein
MYLQFLRPLLRVNTLPKDLCFLEFRQSLRFPFSIKFISGGKTNPPNFCHSQYTDQVTEMVVNSVSNVWMTLYTFQSTSYNKCD